MSDVSDPKNRTKPPLDLSLQSLAIDSNGRLLVSLADIGERDLTGREVYAGVYLTPDEAALVKERLDNAAGETASRILAKLPKR